MAVLPGRLWRETNRCWGSGKVFILERVTVSVTASNSHRVQLIHEALHIPNTVRGSQWFPMMLSSWITANLWLAKNETRVILETVRRQSSRLWTPFPIILVETVLMNQKMSAVLWLTIECGRGKWWFRWDEALNSRLL